MPAVNLTNVNELEKVADSCITEDGKLDAWIHYNDKHIILDISPHTIYDLPMGFYKSSKRDYMASGKQIKKVDVLIAEIDARLSRQS